MGRVDAHSGQIRLLVARYMTQYSTATRISRVKNVFTFEGLVETREISIITGSVKLQSQSRHCCVTAGPTEDARSIIETSVVVKEQVKGPYNARGKKR